MLSDSLAKYDRNGPQRPLKKQDFFSVNSYKVLSELNNSSSCGSLKHELNAVSDRVNKVLPRRNTQAYETSEELKIKRTLSGSH